MCVVLLRFSGAAHFLDSALGIYRRLFYVLICDNLAGAVANLSLSRIFRNLVPGTGKAFMAPEAIVTSWLRSAGRFQCGSIAKWRTPYKDPIW